MTVAWHFNSFTVLASVSMYVCVCVCVCVCGSRIHVALQCMRYYLFLEMASQGTYRHGKVSSYGQRCFLCKYLMRMYLVSLKRHFPKGELDWVVPSHMEDVVEGVEGWITQMLCVSIQNGILN